VSNEGEADIRGQEGTGSFPSRKLHLRPARLLRKGDSLAEFLSLFKVD